MPKHADAPGVLHQKQPNAVRKDRRIFTQRSVRAQPHRLQSGFARAQRVVQAVIELKVQRRCQPARLQALHQIKAQVQVAWVGGKKAKPGTGLGIELVSGCQAGIACRVHRRIQPLQRFGQQRAVNRFLVVKVGIDGAGRVARFPGNFTDAGPFNPQPLEHGAGGVQHPGAAGIDLSLLAVQSGLHALTVIAPN